MTESSSTQQQAAEAAKSRGNELFKLTKYMEAVKEYTKAIRLDPTNPVYLSNRAQCYLRLDRPENAEKDALRCVNLNPRWYKGQYRLGTARAALGKFHEAASAFSDALRFDKDNPDIIRALELARNNASAETAPDHSLRTLDDLSIVIASFPAAKKRLH
eukprot:512733_1